MVDETATGIAGTKARTRSAADRTALLSRDPRAGGGCAPWAYCVARFGRVCGPGSPAPPAVRTRSGCESPPTAHANPFRRSRAFADCQLLCAHFWGVRLARARHGHTRALDSSVGTPCGRIRSSWRLSGQTFATASAGAAPIVCMSVPSPVPPKIWSDPRGFEVLGTGTALPGDPVTTADLLERLARRFGVDVRRRGHAVARRLGIRTRHISRALEARFEGTEPGRGNAELAAAAVREALRDAGTSAAHLR